jgi:hypothetical protein
MSDNLVLLSDIIIRNPAVNNFANLLATIRKQGGAGGSILLQIDLKPDYRDTPRNWEMQVEAAFTWGER